MNQNSFTIRLKAPLMLGILALMLALITACGSSQDDQALPSPVAAAPTTAAQDDQALPSPVATAPTTAAQDDQALPSPVAAALTTAAQYDGERVVVEGYLITDSKISCDKDSICWLWLTAAPEGEDGVTLDEPDEYVLIGIYQIFSILYPNCLTFFPVPWEPEDILVMADDMQEVHLNDRIRVTGWVEVDEHGDVRITGPRPCEDVYGAEERMVLFENHQCPETGFTIELLNK